MSKDEAIRKLNAIERYDREGAHIDADNIIVDYLSSLGGDAKEVAEAYNAARNRVGFWFA